MSDRARKQFADWPKDSARQTLESDIDNIKHDQRGHPIIPIHTGFDGAVDIADRLCTGLATRLGS